VAELCRGDENWGHQFWTDTQSIKAWWQQYPILSREHPDYDGSIVVAAAATTN
tara:strand:+ start:736 stop:894 length:159 start_codon:yes stop_codon:yes gene_type:complete